MSHTFAKFADAEAAGYTNASPTHDQDVSAPYSRGYRYQDDQGNKTVMVYFTQEKQYHGFGTAKPMYPPKQ